MTDDASSHHEPDLANVPDVRLKAEVVQRLLDGHSVALGASAPLPTNFIPDVARQLGTRGSYITRVDASKLNNIEGFARALIQSAIENKSDSSVPESISLKTHADDGQVSPNELLEYAVSIPEFLAEQDDRRMVVVLEEFHELERLGGDELLKRLRAWFQRHVYTTYLFVSSQADRMQPLISQRQQAFYRFAVMLEWPYK